MFLFRELRRRSLPVLIFGTKAQVEISYNTPLLRGVPSVQGEQNTIGKKKNEGLFFLAVPHAVSVTPVYARHG